MSQYTYNVDSNATNVTWSVNSTSAVLPNDVTTNPIVVQFQNSQPDYITLKANYTLNGAALCATKNIALVQVLVNNPAPTNPGTPQNNNVSLAIQITTNTPIYTTTVNPPDNCQGYVLNNGQPSPKESVSLISTGAGNGLSGYSASQTVTLNAPNQVPAALTQIQVGFIQTINNLSGNSKYGADSTNAAKTLSRPQTYAVNGPDSSVDWLTSCPSPAGSTDKYPWYDQTAMTQGQGSGTCQATFTDNDTPSKAFANTYNPNNHNIAAGATDPNANAAIVSGQIIQAFINRTCVNTLDTDNQANTHYFALNQSNWAATYNYPLPANAASLITFSGWTNLNAVTEVNVAVMPTILANTTPFRYDTQVSS